MKLHNIDRATALIEKRSRYLYYCECLSRNRFAIIFDRGAPESVDNSQDKYRFREVLLTYCNDVIKTIEEELEKL